MTNNMFKIFLYIQDGNGFITIGELKETIPLDVEDTENIWEEMVNEVDTDGDGQVKNK